MLDFTKLQNWNIWLIPVIIQNENTKDILMVGFVNKEAYTKTIKTWKVTFWSRTKKRLRTKWETSWNYLFVKKIYSDCDNDSIVIIIKEPWSVCHTWNLSCFNDLYKDNQKNQQIYFLNNLYKTIKERKKNPKQNSYTSQLFEEWLDRITQKVWEEAIETIIASKNSSKKEIIYESADLLFHLFVLLAQKEINLVDITEELKSRQK